MGEEGLRSCDEEVMAEWFGGQERIDMLKKFMEDIVHVGATTVIITYGLPNLVKILLERTGFLDSIYGIKGIFGCVRPGILYNKGHAIISIYETMTSASFEANIDKIVFVDDSKSNIDAVERECKLPSEQNILIDKNTAMVEDHAKIILEIFTQAMQPKQLNTGTDSGINRQSNHEEIYGAGNHQVSQSSGDKDDANEVTIGSKRRSSTDGALRRRESRSRLVFLLFNVGRMTFFLWVFQIDF